MLRWCAQPTSRRTKPLVLHTTAPVASRGCSWVIRGCSRRSVRRIARRCATRSRAVTSTTPRIMDCVVRSVAAQSPRRCRIVSSRRLLRRAFFLRCPRLRRIFRLCLRSPFPMLPLPWRAQASFAASRGAFSREGHRHRGRDPHGALWTRRDACAGFVWCPTQ